MPGTCRNAALTIFFLLAIVPLIPGPAGEEIILGNEKAVPLDKGWTVIRGRLFEELLPPSGSETGSGSASDFIWYQKKIRVNAPGHISPALMIRGVKNSFILYVNGQAVYSTVSAHSFRPADFRNSDTRILLLPPSVPDESGFMQSDLLIYVNAAGTGEPGIYSGIVIGDHDFLKNIYERNLILSGFMTGIFALLFLYNLVLYSARRTDFFYFALAVFFLQTAAVIILQYDLLRADEGAFSSEARYILWWILKWGLLLSLSEFIFSYFRAGNYHYIRTALRFLAAAAALSALLTFKASYLHSNQRYAQLLQILSILVLLLLSVRMLISDFRFRNAFLIPGLAILAIAYAVPEDFSYYLAAASVFSLTASLSNVQYIIHLQAVNKKLDELHSRKSEELEKAALRIQSDLETARRFQESLMPSAEAASMKSAVRYLPVQVVNGDIADITLIGEQHTERYFIADVMGHGVQAALGTMVVRMLYDRLKRSLESPDVILKKLRDYTANEYHMLNINFSCFILDHNKRTGEISYSSAGHPPQLILRSSGEFTELSSRGGLITRFLDKDFELKKDYLHVGDRLILYTDGITEARNPLGMFFSDEGIKASLRKNQKNDPESMASAVIDSLRRHCRGREPEDDILLLIFEKTMNIGPV